MTRRIAAGHVLACAILLLLGTAPAGAYEAPDPGGNPHARVPVPPPGRFFGANDNMLFVSDGLGPTRKLELVEAMGGNVARTSLDWRLLEPIRDIWNAAVFLQARRFYRRALRRDIRPLFTLVSSPRWARVSCRELLSWTCVAPPQRRWDEEWAEFAAEVARRFPRAIIEVWNEPNFRAYWGARSGPDPQRFAELQTIAYRAIKDVRPRTVVLAGGFSNIQRTGRFSIGLRDFLTGAYAARPSIKGHMDMLAFHPYPYSAHLGADSRFAETFADVRGVRRAFHDRSTPLFVTELGVSTAPPEDLRPREQASTLLAAYRRTMTMRDVRGIVVHRLVEPRETNEIEWELGMALTLYGANPPHPRVAYCRFVRLAGNNYPRC